MISTAYAQVAAGAQPDQGGLVQFLPFIVLIIIMYFMMIRPQMKKAKEHKAMIDALQKGDEIITHSGILGRITKLGDVYVSVEIAENTEIHLQKSSVAMILPKGTIKNI